MKRSKATLSTIVRYCDRLLRTAEIKDYDRAANGLQVENDGTVTCVAAAVDASMVTLRLAASAGADLLVAHHGLFWSASHPWTGRRYEMIQFLIENNLAVYSSHLPLDIHPRLGNNARLCAALGFRNLRPFFFDHGQPIGFQTKARVLRTELCRKLEDAVGGPVLMIPGGAKYCERIGVVSGGAGSELAKATAEGIDTFITGEGPHWTYALAEDLGMNVFFAGHYATETFGVKALAKHLSARFRVQWIFVDHPTGL